MKNYLQKGDALTFTAPTGGVTSGVPVLIGSLLVVPVASADQTKKFVGQVVGVISYAKAASQAWTEGVKVYWDNTAKNFTTTVGSNTLVGVASEAVAGGAGDTIGKVRLDGVAR